MVAIYAWNYGHSSLAKTCNNICQMESHTTGGGSVHWSRDAARITRSYDDMGIWHRSNHCWDMLWEASCRADDLLPCSPLDFDFNLHKFRDLSINSTKGSFNDWRRIGNANAGTSKIEGIYPSTRIGISPTMNLMPEGCRSYSRTKACGKLRDKLLRATDSRLNWPHKPGSHAWRVLFYIQDTRLVIILVLPYPLIMRRSPPSFGL